MKRVLDEASKKLADRIASEQALAEDRRNKQLTQFQERFKEHVSVLRRHSPLT